MKSDFPPDGEVVLAWFSDSKDEIPHILRHFDRAGWEIWDYDSGCFEAKRVLAQPVVWVLVSAAKNTTELAKSLKACIANHCPNDRVYCSTCYNARFLLATIGEL
jgi:hypothetical protein